jgi:hypothetical protein
MAESFEKSKAFWVVSCHRPSSSAHRYQKRHRSYVREGRWFIPFPGTRMLPVSRRMSIAPVSLPACLNQAPISVTLNPGLSLVSIGDPMPSLSRF